MKTGVARFRIDLNVPPVFLHDSLNRIEAEPRTLSDPLCGEERFKDVGFYLG